MTLGILIPGYLYNLLFFVIYWFFKVYLFCKVFGRYAKILIFTFLVNVKLKYFINYNKLL
jgi:hypothetical protein